MNIIAIIILITLFADLIIHFLADILNLRMLKHELPEEFRDVYDIERYRQSQEYLRANTRFGWIISAINTVAILGFWFAKGFYFLDIYLRSFGFGQILTGLFYMGILIFVKAIISLPFDIYATFVIEESFGFNKTTWKTFVLDRLKISAILILLGGFLIAGMLSFFEYAGKNAWLYCWIAIILFSLVMQYIVPTLIMPMFNRFDALEEGDLKSAILSYARSVNFPVSNVFIIDGSRRSAKSNAFFTGFGKRRRIALFDTLVKGHTISELVAILAHEIGHYKKKHIVINLIISVLQSGVMFYLLSLFISYPALFDAFYMKEKSVYAGMIFFGMLFSPIDFFLGIFMNIISRKNEYEADRFAVQTTNDPLSLKNALKKLSVNNLSNLLPHPLYVFLNYSHPPVLDRIKAIMSHSSICSDESSSTA